MTIGAMALYLLNTPVLTDYGSYRFTGPLAAEEARPRLAPGFISAIGHKAAAIFLGRLLGIEVPVRRVAVSMAPGDGALVLRLKGRLPDVRVLGEEEMAALPYELGWLERIE